MKENAVPKHKLNRPMSTSDILIDQHTQETERYRGMALANIEAEENQGNAFDAIATGAKLGFQSDSLGGAIKSYKEFKDLQKSYEDEYGSADDAPLLSPADAKKYFNIDTETDISTNQAMAMNVFKREEEILEEEFAEATQGSAFNKVLGWGARLAGQIVNPIDALSMLLTGGAAKLAGPIVAGATKRLLIGQAKGIRKAVSLARRTPLSPLVSRRAANRVAQANIRLGKAIGDDIAKTSNFTKTSVIAGATNVAEISVINKYRKELNLPIFEGLGAYAAAALAPAVLIGVGKTIAKLSEPMSKSMKSWKKSPDVEDDIPVLTGLAKYGADDIIDDVKALVKNYDDLDVAINSDNLKRLLPWISDEKEFIRALRRSKVFTEAQLKTPQSASRALAELHSHQRQTVKQLLFDISDEGLAGPARKQLRAAPKAVNRDESRKLLGAGETDVPSETQVIEKFKRAARANDGIEDSVQQQAKKSQEALEKKPKTEGEAAKVEEPEKIRPLKDMSAEEQVAAITAVNKEIAQAMVDFIKCRGG